LITACLSAFLFIVFKQYLLTTARQAEGRLSSNIKCTCGHLDDFTAFETSTNGVWECPACKTVTDTRKNYEGEELRALAAERAEMKEFV
jgi:hypothetical protein